MKYRLLFAIAALSALLLGGIPRVAAEEENKQQIAFFIRPEFQADQIEDSGYFYFDMKPGEARTLAITVVNTNTSEATVNLRAVNAATGERGEIVYPGDAVGADDFSGMVQIDENTVVIPANSAVSVSARVRVPEGFAGGEILGGLVVAKIPDGAGEKPGISITNRYEYLVAVRMRVGALPAPDFSLGGARVDRERGLLFLAVSNNAQRVLQGVRLNVALAGLDFLREGISFAPASGAEILIEDERLKSLPAEGNRVQISIEYGGEVYTMEALYEA